MATLNITETAINRVHYRELEQFIADFYQIPFEILESMYYPNNASWHHYNVSSALCETEEIQCWLAGASGEPSLWYILEDLCFRGVLDPGEYLIQVC